MCAGVGYDRTPRCLTRARLTGCGFAAFEFVSGRTSTCRGVLETASAGSRPAFRIEISGTAALLNNQSLVSSRVAVRAQRRSRRRASQPRSSLVAQNQVRVSKQAARAATLALLTHWGCLRVRRVTLTPSRRP